MMPTCQRNLSTTSVTQNRHSFADRQCGLTWNFRIASALLTSPRLPLDPMLILSTNPKAAADVITSILNRQRKRFGTKHEVRHQTTALQPCSMNKPTAKQREKKGAERAATRRSAATAPEVGPEVGPEVAPELRRLQSQSEGTVAAPGATQRGRAWIAQGHLAQAAELAAWVHSQWVRIHPTWQRQRQRQDGALLGQPGVHALRVAAGPWAAPASKGRRRQCRRQRNAQQSGTDGCTDPTSIGRRFLVSRCLTPGSRPRQTTPTNSPGRP